MNVHKLHVQAASASAPVTTTVAPAAKLLSTNVRIFDLLLQKKKTMTSGEITKVLAKEGYNPGSVKAAITDMRNNCQLDNIEGSGARGDPYRVYILPGAARPEEGSGYAPRPSKSEKTKARFVAVAASIAVERKRQEEIKVANAAPKLIPATTNNSLQTEILRVSKGLEAFRKMPNGGVGQATEVKVEAIPDVPNVPEAKLETSAPEVSSGIQILWRGQTLTMAEFKAMYEDMKLFSDMFCK